MPRPGPGPGSHPAAIAMPCAPGCEGPLTQSIPGVWGQQRCYGSPRSPPSVCSLCPPGSFSSPLPFLGGRAVQPVGVLGEATGAACSPQRGPGEEQQEGAAGPRPASAWQLPNSREKCRRAGGVVALPAPAACGSGESPGHRWLRHKGGRRGRAGGAAAVPGGTPLPPLPSARPSPAGPCPLPPLRSRAGGGKPGPAPGEAEEERRAMGKERRRLSSGHR